MNVKDFFHMRKIKVLQNMPHNVRNFVYALRSISSHVGVNFSSLSDCPLSVQVDLVMEI